MKLKRNDLIFILSLLLISTFGLVYLFVLRPTGGIVKVTVDGKVYATYPLNQDMTKDIFTGEKNQVNKLVIKDGKARIEYASCPDGICSSHYPISRNGESIICLPNRVVISVIDCNEDSADIVS